jgi:hypothetical protein
LQKVLDSNSEQCSLYNYRKKPPGSQRNVVSPLMFFSSEPTRLPSLLQGPTRRSRRLEVADGFRPASVDKRAERVGEADGEQEPHDAPGRPGPLHPTGSRVEPRRRCMGGVQPGAALRSVAIVSSSLVEDRQVE